MVYAERMKELAGRGMEESLAGHVHSGLRSKQQAVTETGETEQSEAEMGVRCWGSAPGYPGDSVQMAISHWTGSPME